MRREEVVKAIMTIREWCEHRDAIEGCCEDCPMGDMCHKIIFPCDWAVEE